MTGVQTCALPISLEEVAVEGELPDERIDLAERERHGRMAFEIAPDELVGGAEVEREGTRVLDGGRAVGARQGEEPLDAPDGPERVVGVERRREGADVGADRGRPRQEREGGRGGAPRPVVGVFAIAAGMLALVLAQERIRQAIEDADGALVPRDEDLVADPARRDAVIGGGDLDAAVEVHGARAELVVAKGRLRFAGQD